MKRTSDHQLTKDNAADADAAAEEPRQGFQRASPEVLAKRRILKARRTPNLKPPSPAPNSNPFASLANSAQSADVKPVETPAEQPKEKPPEASAAKPAEAPVEKPVEHLPAEHAEVLDTALESAQTTGGTPSEKTIKAPAETAAPASGSIKEAEPSKTEDETKPPPAKPATEIPTNHVNKTPSEQSNPTPPLAATQPTPAPLKQTTTPANGTPKPAIIFGAGTTTKPVTFASAAQSDGFNFKSAQAPPKVEEKKPEFKEATILTGEENDKELYRTRAKLYSLETGENGPRWKERGVGSLKLNKNTETGNARLLMRTEATLRVVLNTPVFKGFQMDRATDRSIRFQGFDADDTQKSTSFLARFSTKDVTSEMIEAIEKCKNELK